MTADGAAGAELGATLDYLNDRYGIGAAVRFVAGPGDLPLVQLHHQGATAAVSLLGATVLAYQPRGGLPVLFVSRASAFAPGRPIRGGIPVCWPWFGAHPSDPTLPNHGFVRTAMWSVEETETGSEDGGEVEATLRLTSSDETRALWPHPFDLRLTARLGDSLTVSLEAHRPAPDGALPGEPDSEPDGAPYTVTGALHTYLAVGDAAQIVVRGLEGARYVDKAAGGGEGTQEGPLTIAGETDRVYLDTPATVTVEDPLLGRRLAIAKEGSRSTVVWNPWQRRAEALPDFGDDEYRLMVCVETANAMQDVVVLPPGGSHVLQTVISAS
jgi:glucose-6-phosphate 1-epimerase